MTGRMLIRTVAVGICAVAIGAVVSQPAYAQQSSLRGKVVDEEGKPVAKATVEIKAGGNYNQTFTVETNDRGEWFKGGLAGFGGVWTITVTSGEMSAVKANVRSELGQVTPVPDIVLEKGGVEAFKNDPTNLSEEEIKKRNEETAAMKKLFTDAAAAYDSGNYDEAIVKLNGIIEAIDNCDVCYNLLGDVNVKKGDLEAAEAAYKKSIEFNPDKPAPYTALAGIYNTQRKFEDAAAMSAKAGSLTGGTTAEGGAGGGDASSSYNQGIALWNAGKPAEAQAAFENAVKLDPKMADAHYWLGMAYVNQGKLKEAKTPFETYLKLEPDGDNAVTAKALLAQIGG